MRPITRTASERGLERLRQVFDLEPVEFPTATRDAAYLAEQPEECARDVVDPFADRDVPVAADLEGAILAVEPSEELPAHTWVAGVHRALGEREVLERFDGVLVGRPAARSHLEDVPPAERERYRENQREAIESVFYPGWISSELPTLGALADE